MKHIFPFLLTLLTILTSCDDLFDVHPYAAKITGERDINAKNAEKIHKKMMGRRAFRFALISDTQRWYDETQDLVSDINARDSIDFVVHGGDLTDFGVTKEFLWQRDILGGLKVPYITVIGNHDCQGSGEEAYKAIWGQLNYAFNAGDVRFVCINTNALEYDYSTPVPDLAFMEDEILNFPTDEAQRTIIVAHCKPYDEQFNNNLARFYHYYVMNFPGVMCGIGGHTHRFEDADIFNDGFHYITTTSTDDRAYLIFTINEGGYSYEKVHF